MAQVPDVLGQVIVCALSTADAEEGGKKVHKAPCADVGPCKTWLTAADAYPRNPVSATAMVPRVQASWSYLPHSLFGSRAGESCHGPTAPPDRAAGEPLP